MKIFIKFVVIFSFLISNAIAVKFSHKVGDIVENEVFFGKRIKFPLPPGKFKVAVVHKSGDFRDAMLYQIDQETGKTRWAIQFAATGNTQWEGWQTTEMCDRKDVYFVKVKKGNNKFACWIVNHSRSDIGASSGFWSKVRDYEIKNNISTPDIFVYSHHQYSKGSKFFESSYYYNPELDGVPKPKNIQWETNEFHVQRVKNYPKHEAFLKKYIGISASLINRFNQNHKVKGSLTLDASSLANPLNIVTEDSISASKDNLIEDLKNLKKLLDDGVITQEEFKKAKKNLLNQ